MTCPSTLRRGSLQTLSRGRSRRSLWSDSIWALWFFACLYTVLDASIPVVWASVGDFFGRKSFGTIRGNMNLFYTWGAILGPYAGGMVYDRESHALVFSAITVALLIPAAC